MLLDASVLLQFLSQRKFKKGLYYASSGPSQVDQAPRIHLAMQGKWFWSLVGELRSHVPWNN